MWPLPDLSQFIGILFPLGLAALLGGIIGLERESAGRPAGLRTHVLVAVGSALIMQISLDMLRYRTETWNPDPGRIAAQIVSGIGFLGAGTIMREGVTVRGLTTAASLWVVAAVGMAVGSGLYLEAAAASVLILLTLTVLRKVEERFIRIAGVQTLTVQVMDTPGRLGDLASVIARHGGNIRSVSLRGGTAPGTVEITFRLRLPPRADAEALVAELLTLDGVLQVTEEE
ncbi:MAG: MgtC/SapB family protein [Firmicutes bacterium]|nr:MgtC/SapB family protein [Bacillota bacterium]